MNELVTIIIPVYNKEKYVERCLESVYSQNYRKIEVIIVDDGSSDNSASKINEFIVSHAAANFKYYYKENGGLSSARNYGLTKAKGDFVFFLDSDDKIKYDAIDTLVKNNIGNDIVVGRYEYEYIDGKIDSQGMASFSNFEANNLSTTKLYRYIFEEKYGINACNKLYKKSFIDFSGILFQDNDYIYAEDLLFNVKLLAYNPRIKIIDDLTYIYYRNDDSITYTYQKMMAERYANLVNEYYSCFNSREDLLMLICSNAINCICGQEKRYSEIVKQLKIYRNNVLGNINFKKCYIYKNFKGFRKLDFAFNIKLLKRAINVLALYQWGKNHVRK